MAGDSHGINDWFLDREGHTPAWTMSKPLKGRMCGSTESLALQRAAGDEHAEFWPGQREWRINNATEEQCEEAATIEREAATIIGDSPILARSEVSPRRYR